ncbi:MAG: PP0621 family protein [Betaproteobacteria bacterium]
MKYLVILAVFVIVLWLARSSGRRSAVRRPPPAGKIEDMVRCAHCGLHLPRGEALPGRGGLYCGEAHRAEHERELAGR